jgi:hypothetical protein
VLRESIYKVEEIKLQFAAQQDPTERRLQELQPIDSEDTGRRNNFRANLSQVRRNLYYLFVNDCVLYVI